jgi:hypothetical protein
MQVTPQPLPEHALLARYAGRGAYADCFVTEIPGEFTHAEYVRAFYTTWLFKLERRILEWLVAKPSTDEQAAQLARGERATFAAWTVEASAPNQLLLCDFRGNTRSWLMVESRAGGGATCLYFGSAIVPRIDADTGRPRVQRRFRAVLRLHVRYSRALGHFRVRYSRALRHFHVRYSRALLNAARRRLTTG